MRRWKRSRSNRSVWYYLQDAPNHQEPFVLGLVYGETRGDRTAGFQSRRRGTESKRFGSLQEAQRFVERSTG